MTNARNLMLDYLRVQVLGPTSANELLDMSDRPHDKYLLGTLFPKETEANEIFADDIIEEGGGGIGDDVVDDPIVLANQYMPSSVGVSLVARTSALSVQLTGARYQRVSDGWQRIPLVEDLNITPAENQPLPVFGGAANVHQIWRPTGENIYIVTVALVNSASGGRPVDPERCLYQVGIRCGAPDGEILPYPTSGVFHLDEEAEDLALLYSQHPSFAIGHGCATDWILGDGRKPLSVSTEFLPTEIVPEVAFDVAGFEDILSFVVLGSVDRAPSPLLGRLGDFVDSYDEWIRSLRENSEHISAQFRAARRRLLARLETASFRMRSGVSLLAKDPTCRAAFALANRAMLMQMRHAKDDLGGTRKTRSRTPIHTPDYEGLTEYRWRPFQLAFLLLALEGVSDPLAPDRAIVDLIWFPTGGGKTEAYFGLIAYTIMLRRLRHGDRGGGTAVITRYTLRLLTSQQFQRAATLICACELLRRSRQQDLGSEPISIGIWVGGDSSPNRYHEAAALLDELQAGESPSKSFQLELCPWCGTELAPEKPTGNDDDYGFVATDVHFSMHCPSAVCLFHNQASHLFCR